MSARKVVGIVGAAIGGPTLGLQILSHPNLRRNFEPILIDRISLLSCTKADELLPSGGAAVALFANGLFPLYNLGLRAALDAVSSEMSSLTVWTADYGSVTSVGAYKRLNSVANPTWSHELQTGVRAIERVALQRLLVAEYISRGGDARSGKQASSFSRLSNGQIRVTFDDHSELDVDLLVGADGAYSSVRRFILGGDEKRWLPHFTGITGFYGISRPTQTLAPNATASAGTHAFWLKDGSLSVAPLPNGRLRWDLMVSENAAPHPISPIEPSPEPTVPWASTIQPALYSRTTTIEILQKHAGVYHPSVGSFGALLDSAERIIQSPLRQRVWEEDEIQAPGVVLVGDAARVMLPSSGQGTGFAIEDATVLANSLLAHACGESFETGLPNALEGYAKQRVPRSKKMAMVAYASGHLSLGTKWYTRLVRGWGARLSIGSNLKARAGKDPWPFDFRSRLE
ncbi:Salicylate hydroxylase [Mycena kentingensis (nom. inval.)]|nr:Salicylate hydroxylase [Mycena kentingensis (nom. inval.)]